MKEEMEEEFYEDFFILKIGFIFEVSFYELFFLEEKSELLREKLNEFFVLRDISLICYFLDKFLIEVFERIKWYYI